METRQPPHSSGVFFPDQRIPPFRQIYTGTHGTGPCVSEGGYTCCRKRHRYAHEHSPLLPSDNACSNLLELQKKAALLSWNKAGENEFTFACHLANKLEIEVLWEPFNEYTISTAPNITLATFSVKAGLQLRIQILGEQVPVKYLSIDVAGFITTTTDHGKLRSLQIDGQAHSPGLPSLREAIPNTYIEQRYGYRNCQASRQPGLPMTSLTTESTRGPPQRKTWTK